MAVNSLKNLIAGKKPFKVAIFINIRAINSIDMLHEVS